MTAEAASGSPRTVPHRIGPGSVSWRLNGIRARVFALALICIVVPGVLVGDYFAGRADARLAAAGEQARAEAQSVARELDALVLQSRTLMRTLTLVPEVVEGRGGECEVSLRRVRATTSWIETISVVRPDGIVACSTNPQAAGLDISDRPHIRQAIVTHGFVLSDLTTSRTRPGSRSIYAAEPLLRPDGRVQVVVAIALDPVSLLLSIVDRLGTDRRVGIIDSRGVLMARYPPMPEAIGRSLLNFPLTGLALSTAAGHTRSASLDGGEAVFGYAPLGNSGARILVGLDVPRLLDAIDSERRSSFILLAVVGSLLLLAGLIGGEVLLIRPIEALRRTIGQLAEGDLTARARLGQASAPELVALAEQVSVMAERLAAEERALIEARDAATAASEAKTWFLGAASHELRTPLNGVLGWAQALLHDRRLPAELREGVETIRSSAQHLATIVSRLLDIARIETGRLGAPEQAEADPLALARDCVALMRPAAERAGLALLLDVPGPLPPRLRLDGTRMKQILINLLDNAVKFTPAGEVRLRLEMRPGAQGGGVLRAEVLDTGPGAPAALRGRLFQDFVHLDPTGRDSEGVGLGLSVSARMAAHLGGRIGHADRSDGRPGSLFWVELPVSLPASAPLAA
ncbi:hypothetical protein JMJ55_12840 [Belnapia sp. T6]|uniref:histidine kinase n=1 Tax=Belnapia mucosa TaxID=2804532 RepID=A0ABS1V3D8_9PROT|nr:ATP-binding protein [Belnapia mucosa]MBL6456213.1 hypothetical protein [Belnapia mucosa]